MLADGLTYAQQLGATHLIDAATLTGAIGVALGMVNAGAFSNDDETYEKFDAALETSGEKFWRLPLGEEYADLIKSDIGDIKNTGGRWGGAITAAEFLQRLCRRHALDSPRHRRPGLGGRLTAVHRQGAKRGGRAIDSGVGAKLFSVTPRVSTSLGAPGLASGDLGRQRSHAVSNRH